MVGIKGTGMCALAEILQSRGNRLTGSDVTEVFYTDDILKSLKIPFVPGFFRENLPADCRLVIYSSAYDPRVNPELVEARKRGIPLMEYTQALGELSRDVLSLGVAGVHGKTTTTALTGSLVKAGGLPGTVLAGSAVKGFGNRSTLIQGDEFFIAETCEYRRNFLRFHPDLIILTSVEEDHQDYFKGFQDILDAFGEYVLLLPPGGRLIFCQDDPGAARAAEAAAARRGDLRLIPYGFTAQGPWRIREFHREPGASCFHLEGWPQEKFRLLVPGRHTALNAVAALAGVAEIMGDLNGPPGPGDRAALVQGIKEFSGSRRRSEILGEAGGILFMDDYAHHPSAIKATLLGYREFFPGRRLVVDFMSHTYSRTAALFEEFADSFGAADLLILHKIYSSAREEEAAAGAVTGRKLYEKIRAGRDSVYYSDEPGDAWDFCLENLQEGDVFVTMGAGNNWTLGHRLFTHKGGTLTP